MRRNNFTAEPGKQEIVVTSIFDAPRELVFKAYTNPDLIPHWWGPGYLTTMIDKLDLRPGGLWRFIQHDASGNEYAFHGVYHEVAAPERLVYTFEFEGEPGHVVLAIETFEVQPDGRTKLTDKSVFESVEDRDGMLNTGMEAVSTEITDRLAELLARL
jgi:uncharacterized protein YndB with AHSA1/START domain